LVLTHPIASGWEPERPIFPENLATLRETLRTSCGDEPEILAKLLGLLVENTNHQMNELESAILAADPGRIGLEAHSLKGVFLTVGANWFAEVCQKLIELDLDHAGNRPTIVSAFRTIRQNWKRLQDEAIDFLDHLPGTDRKSTKN
jgi:HPt (histidine-containing phosphotransfer) domain-containing protein